MTLVEPMRCYELLSSNRFRQQNQIDLLFPVKGVFNEVAFVFPGSLLMILADCHPVVTGNSDYFTKYLIS